MNCPKCGSPMKVIDTREKSSGNIYRRRKCVKCSYRMSSIELTNKAYLDYLEDITAINHAAKHFRRAMDILQDVKDIEEID